MLPGVLGLGGVQSEDDREALGLGCCGLGFLGFQLVLSTSGKVEEVSFS